MADFITLPAIFMGDRIFVQPMTTEGVRLTLYTDTGGGGMFIEPETVKRLDLPVGKRIADNTEYETVPFPQFHPDAHIPAGNKSNELFLLPGTDESRDGLLGQSWFAERVWKFDYIGRQLAFHEAENLSQPLDHHCCVLGFLTDDKGERQNSFARIQATIDGDLLDFLFDTGATVHLTEDAMNLHFNDGDSKLNLRGTLPAMMSDPSGSPGARTVTFTTICPSGWINEWKAHWGDHCSSTSR